MRCGDRVSLSFSADFSLQNLVVTLPGAVGQSYVSTNCWPSHLRRRLAAFAIALDRDAGGQFGEAISYPAGDRSDLIQLSAPNLATDRASSYREYTVSLLCSGAGVEYVRWGRPDNPNLLCNTAAIVPLSLAANLQELVVSLPEGSGQTYVSYTLRAVPAAPYDTAEFLFGLDRDSGGQFNESISYPDGDRSDLIQVTISNLIDRPPDNYREVSLTLYCSGVGAEQVRWGLPDKPNLLCGQTIKMPFIANSNRAPLAVVLPDGSAQSYIHYTLVASPVT
jgi:hypothetical protein